MIKENQAEFDKSGLSYWLAEGYTGRATILVLDDNGKPRAKDNIETPFNDSGSEARHKTQVCGVLREVAPSARIIAFNYFGGRKDEIVAWIIEHKDEIDIVNCSFSSMFTSTEGHMKRIYDAGITIISASGNGGNIDRLVKPATFDTTIAFGAFEEYRDKVAYYSNGGKELDALAFTDIYIPTYTNTVKVKFNGTSCASPVGSGQFAYYIEWRHKNKLPKIHPDESKKFIQFNTRDLYEAGFDLQSGYGLFKLPSEIPEVKGVAMIKEPEIIIPKGVGDMTFKDIDTHWAKGAIEFITDKGIMAGYPDGTFQPDRALTRAEYAFMKAKELGYVEVKK